MARCLLASSMTYPPTQQILSNNSLICYLQAVSIDVWLNVKKEKRHNSDAPAMILFRRITNYHVQRIKMWHLHPLNPNRTSQP